MKVKSIHLKNFKRFTDLVIDGIPETSKLVLLIGANGSGKSSLFDAFGFCTASIKRDFANNDEFWHYFQKRTDQNAEVKVEFHNDVQLNLSKDKFFSENRMALNSFYGRTSFRHIPKLTRTALGQGGTINIENDSDRPRFFIERDHRFENDLDRITESIVKDIFRLSQSDKQKKEIKEKYINPVNAALSNIFVDEKNIKIELIEMIPPLEEKAAQINFRKGNSEIPYDFLSAGEKEIFNLLINLLSRGSLYQNTIYYLDEMDLHLNTKLQANVLKEIVNNWIPENSQLWTASHSLGFIEYAKKNEHASIIDFDYLDFDVAQNLTPEPKDNYELYDIAVGEEILSSLFKDRNIYFVENKDIAYYATLGLKKEIFVSANNKNSVYHKVRTTGFYGIVDRDYLSDDDIFQIKKNYKNLYVLEYYSIENYLYHPDNLEEYYKGKGKDFDKQEYIKQMTAAKNDVKFSIISSLTLIRTGYHYFGEPQYDNKPALQNRFKGEQENIEQSTIIANYLNDDNFEVFYKALPMKTYCTQLPQRQHIPKSELAKTKWFNKKISTWLKQPNKLPK
jgi:AAA15 family ATPase/GTPase